MRTNGPAGQGSQLGSRSSAGRARDVDRYGAVGRSPPAAEDVTVELVGVEETIGAIDRDLDENAFTGGSSPGEKVIVYRAREPSNASPSASTW